jgi:hypothetical protein
MTYSSSKKVLSDHRKVGKKLIPPLLDLIGESDYSYRQNGIPQIIWISIIIHKLGLKDSIRLISEYIKVLNKLNIKNGIPYYLSWYSNLSDSDAQKITKALHSSDIYDKMNIHLSSLLNVHPSCPLNKIFMNKPMQELDLPVVKRILGSLLDKTSFESTMTLTALTYILSSCGILRIADSEISLPDPNSIFDYPNTEDSRHLGSFVRSASTGLLSEIHIKEKEPWVSDFWKRGMLLEPCQI